MSNTTKAFCIVIWLHKILDCLHFLFVLKRSLFAGYATAKNGNVLNAKYLRNIYSYLYV